MRKKKKSALGKIIQISASRDTLYVLTDRGTLYEYVVDENDYGEWEQLTDFTPNNVVSPDEADEEEEEEEDED